MTGKAADSYGATTSGSESGSGTPALGVVIIRHEGQVHRLKHYPGETLLETARRGSVQMNFSCERGECGTCIVTILSGEVTMRANQVLSEDDIKQGLTLGCQSVPITETVEIELP